MGGEATTNQLRTIFCYLLFFAGYLGAMEVIVLLPDSTDSVPLGLSSGTGWRKGYFEWLMVGFV